MTGFSFWVLNSLIEANEEVILDTLGQEIRDASSFQMLPENGESSSDVSSVNIPPDQIRTIENINTLVSEVPSTPYIFWMVNLLLVMFFLCPDFSKIYPH